MLAPVFRTREFTMPRGNHYGRNKTRSYTEQYRRISAISFKPLIKAPLGEYVISGEHLSEDHQKLALIENSDHVRIALFDIQGHEHQIALRLDNRSASNKLYISCPYCQKSKQHLYIVVNAYACRTCLRLHYPSQSERPRIRLMRRIRKRRKELWGADWPEINNMFHPIDDWPKPDGMRWHTFFNKRDAIIKLENRYWPIMGIWLDKTYGHFLKPEF